MRLCANTGAQLHVIHPLGFSLDAKQLRRAGMDYLIGLHVEQHQNYEAFLAYMQDCSAMKRLFVCSTKAQRNLDTFLFQSGDVFLFGSEGSGLPDAIIARAQDEDRALTVPMVPNSRSLNLANAVSVVIYEAWRQQGYALYSQHGLNKGSSWKN